MTKYEIKKDFEARIQKLLEYKDIIFEKNSFKDIRNEIFEITVQYVMKDYINEIKYITEFLNDGYCVRMGKYEAVENVEDFAIIIADVYSNK